MGGRVRCCPQVWTPRRTVFCRRSRANVGRADRSSGVAAACAVLRADGVLAGTMTRARCACSPSRRLARRRATAARRSCTGCSPRPPPPPDDHRRPPPTRPTRPAGPFRHPAPPLARRVNPGGRPALSSADLASQARRRDHAVRRGSTWQQRLRRATPRPPTATRTPPSNASSPGGCC